MTSSAPTPAELPPDDMDAWYTECPRCGLVGPAESAQYTLTGPGSAGRVDWAKPVRLHCTACGHQHDVGLVDLLDRDAEHACSRCRQVTPVPAGAARVICLHCHLYAAGPATRTDVRVADQLHATEHLHHLEQLAAVQDAKRRAGLDPDQPL